MKNFKIIKLNKKENCLILILEPIKTIETLIFIITKLIFIVKNFIIFFFLVRFEEFFTNTILE